MSLEAALALAAKGFYVFPLEPGLKKPLWKGWQDFATCDTTELRAKWPALRGLGVGISTCRWRDPAGEGAEWDLFCVDIDSKRGDAPITWMAELTASGLLPPTYTQHTPSGGLHLFYLAPHPIHASHGTLAEGIDIHGAGYLAVGAGTVTAAGAYVADLSVAPVPAPQQLIDLCGEKKLRPAEEIPVEPPAGVNLAAAMRRGATFLKGLEPAPEGRRNPLAYQAACHLKQLAIPNAEAFELMLNHFQAEPPLEPAELWDATVKAFKHSQGAYGELAPERIFHKEERAPEEEAEATGEADPADYFNRDHALVSAGSSVRVLKEIFDEDGQPDIKLLRLDEFHSLNANQTFQDGAGKRQPMSKFWLTSPRRRTYDGIVFDPSMKAPDRFYNRWRGFANGFPEELPQIAHDALGNLLRLSAEAYCHNDKPLHYLHMAYFAHMVQKTSVKAQTAHVYQSGQGHGKDTFVDAMGAMCPAHYMNTAERKHVISGFNAHFENKLLFVANELSWAHDHEIYNKLKQLVTGRIHHIERKGCEIYKVKNLCRVVIMGNAKTLLKISRDERRYIFFELDDKFKHNPSFFNTIYDGMKAGGTKLLFDYLTNFDLSNYNMNHVPVTQGLIDHKRANLDPVHEWLIECVEEGRILGGTFAGDWPVVVDREPMRRACVTWCNEQGRNRYAPGSALFGARLREVFGSVDSPRRSENGRQINTYRLPELEEARAAFRRFLGEVAKK